MAKRKGKSSNKQEDPWLPAEPSAPAQPRAINEFVLPVILFLIVAVGGSWLGWIYTDQQQAIESLSETLMSLQGRINKLQQQFEPGAAQLASVGGLEERLVILEEAYAKAQRQVEIALATSEQIRSKDLHSKVWSLQTEMNSKLAELQQNTISIAALDAMIKNKSTELEIVKQDVNAMLTANSELAITISGFTNALLVTNSHFDEQSSVVDSLMSQLEGQRNEISELQELFNFNQRAVGAHAQELIDLKELLEIEHVKKTHALGKQLRFLKKSLQNHQSKTEMLHSQLTAHLEAVQTQYWSKPHQLGKLEDKPQVKKFLAADSVKQPMDFADKKEQAHEEVAEYTEKQEFAKESRTNQEKKSAQEEEINKDHGAKEKDGLPTDKETTVEKEMAEKQTTREEEAVSVEQETSQKEKMPEEQETVNTKEMPKDLSATNSEVMRNEEQETKLKDEMPKKHQADKKKKVSEEHQTTEKYEIEKAINAKEISEQNEKEHMAKKMNDAEGHEDVTVSEEVQTHLEEKHINKKEERTTNTLVELDSVITKAETGNVVDVQMELTEEIQALSKKNIKNELEESGVEFSDSGSNEIPLEDTGISPTKAKDIPSEEADMVKNKNEDALNGKNIEHNVATDIHSHLNEIYIQESEMEKNVDTENQPRSVTEENLTPLE